jgi:hypothetical protein
MKKRSFAVLVPSLLFLLLIFRPLYASYLREKAAAADPAAWAAHPLNGRFSMLVPQLAASRVRDEVTYASGVQQIRVHGRPYSPYLREHRALHEWTMNFIPFYLVAAVGAVAGLGISWTWILAGALTGALWGLLFYLVFARWTDRPAVAAPLALFCGFYLDFHGLLLDVNFSPALNLARLAQTFAPQGAQLLPHWHRMTSPFLSVLMTAGLLLAAWRLAQCARPRYGAAAALGAGLAAMAFAHSFEFVFGGASFALFAVWAWLKGHPRRKDLALALAVCVLLSALLSAWLFFSRDARAWNDTLEISGLLRSRRFYKIAAVHLLVAALAAWKARGAREPWRRDAWALLACAQAAAFLCRNSQVLTGLLLQPFHYIPMASLFGSLVFYLWGAEKLAAWKAWGNRAGLAAGAAVVLAVFVFQKGLAERTYPLLGLPRDMEAALDWTDANLPKDALVLSLSMEANLALPLYTKAKLPVQPVSAPYAAIIRRDEHILRLAQLLKGAGADAPRFLKERWLPPGEWMSRMDRLQRLQVGSATTDLALVETVEWFATYLYGRLTDQDIADAHRDVLAALPEAKDPPRPFWLWVGPHDAPLLKTAPEKRGGRLVYENASTRLYAFD